MKKLHALLMMAFTLFTQSIWAPAYDSDSDSDGVEFRKFEKGDKISMERFILNTEISKVRQNHRWVEMKTRIWTQWPQQLIQFRQEGDLYRLYTRPLAKRNFDKQSGLWRYESDGALFMPQYYCCKIVEEYFVD